MPSTKRRKMVVLMVFSTLIQTLFSHAEELWITPRRSAASDKVGNWALTGLGNAYFTFSVPEDFDGFVSSKVVVIGASDRDLSALLKLSVSQDQDAHDLYSDTGSVEFRIKDNQLLEIDVSEIVRDVPDGLMEGLDYLSLKFTTRPKQSREEVKIIGMRFVYTVGPGGENNRASGISSTVSGGTSNLASGEDSTVSGGSENIASSTWATVSGGNSNTASGVEATVSGGESNMASAGSSLVSGGRRNRAAGGFSVVGGGLSNTASSDSSTVSGGRDNSANGERATVGGGAFNVASRFSSTVCGGGNNTASGERSTVGGGTSNTGSGLLSTVAGGSVNTAMGSWATVSGGRNGRASGQRSTVAGGDGNEALGDFSTVSGGEDNTASGSHAVVCGGQENSAAGDWSWSGGRKGKAEHQGSFVWADSSDFPFSSTAEDEFSVRAVGGARIVSSVEDDSGEALVGVQLAPGAGAWSALSDRESKEHVRRVDGKTVLEKLIQLPIARWNWKGQDPRIQHIGPLAQDFYQAFEVGEDDRHINTVDTDGVALAAIQGLYEKAEEQRVTSENRDAELKLLLEKKDIELKKLKARLHEMEKRLHDLEI